MWWTRGRRRKRDTERRARACGRAGVWARERKGWRVRGRRLIYTQGKALSIKWKWWTSIQKSCVTIMNLTWFWWTSVPSSHFITQAYGREGHTRSIFSVFFYFCFWWCHQGWIWRKASFEISKLILWANKTTPSPNKKMCSEFWWRTLGNSGPIFTNFLCPNTLIQPTLISAYLSAIRNSSRRNKWWEYRGGGGGGMRKAEWNLQNA